MECPICRHQDPHFFLQKKEQICCRICLQYQYPIAKIPPKRPPKRVTPIYPHPLTLEQQQLSNQILHGPQEMYISAVCGAGKTEATYAAIAVSVQQGKRVGFAVPRRELVLELGSRLQAAFPKLAVTLVYGGHSHALDGDIIALTTHQIARYQGKFGLLILDEYDAFPFHKNASLLGYARLSTAGRALYLSATFSKTVIKNHAVATLNRRHHGVPIPIPKVIVGYTPGLIQALKRFLQHHLSLQHPVIIYVPTRRRAEQLGKILQMIHADTLILHSQSLLREQVFRMAQMGRFSWLVSTSILERGITIDGLQVVIWEANHPIYDEATLTQMVGRVGRTVEHSFGEVMMLSQTQSVAMMNVVKELKQLYESMLDLWEDSAGTSFS